MLLKKYIKSLFKKYNCAQFILGVLFLLFVPNQKSYGQVDSTYIKDFDYNFTISSYVLKDFISVIQRYDKSDRVTLYPNNPINLGLGFSIKNTMLNISYGYGLQFLRDSEYGKTSAFDLQLHNYGRKYVLDIYVQRYRGFYQKKSNRKGGMIVYPDIKIRQYGVLGQYIFNNKHFSYKAAFDQDERQLKSAGSLLVGGSVFKSILRSDSTFTFNNSTLLKTIQIGANVGYAYNFVINKNFFLSGSLSLGINAGSRNFKQFKKKIDISPNVISRLSLGYNRESWSLGLSFVSNILYSSISDNTSIALQSGGLQFTFIRRVNLSLKGKNKNKTVK